jgi:hypothetical protein
MEQEGGKLSYLDESEVENEENGFYLKLGIYLFINKKPILLKEIYILGSADLTRISSGKCHKKALSNTMRKLNIWITKIRKSVELTIVFANAKCRQQLEKKTRWGSTCWSKS